MPGTIKVRRGPCEREASFESAAISGAARAHARALAADETLLRWTDPKLAAAFATDVLGHNDYYSCGFWDVWNLDSETSGDRIYRAMLEGWVQDWRDRGKADAFVAEGFRLQDESEQEMEAEFQEQWQEEHGWKYCPHGDKYWDCPHCSDEWHGTSPPSP